MGILVRSLLSLPPFNPLLEEINFLLVLFPQLSLDALVLNILKSVHAYSEIGVLDASL